ncbi:MAG: fibronectin type III domain-containing protein, partial [Planctomycetota bacterium]
MSLIRGQLALLLFIIALVPRLAAADTQAPSVPTGLRARAYGFTKVTVSWTESSDDTGVTGYRVYRGSVAIADTATLEYVDATLVTGGTYTYSLKAFDEAGNLSAASPPVSVTTFSYPDLEGMDDVATVHDQQLENHSEDAAVLIQAVQQGMGVLRGEDASFSYFDAELVQKMVERSLAERGEPKEYTDAERAELEAKLQKVLDDNFASNSFLHVYTHAKLVELGEEHWQKGMPAPAETLYEYSLNFLSNVESYTFNSLWRLGYIRIHSQPETARPDQLAAALNHNYQTLQRFFTYFPGSTSNLAYAANRMPAFETYRRFPTILKYDEYQTEAYENAITAITAANAIKIIPNTPDHLTHMKTWERVTARVTLVDTTGRPGPGHVIITNTSDASLWLGDKVEDVRDVELAAETNTVPFYRGHSYSMIASVGTLQEDLESHELPAYAFQPGKRTFVNSTDVVIEDLSDPNGEPEIFFVFNRENMRGRGLKGNYFDNIDFTGPSITRLDPALNFDWGTNRPHALIESDTFSV